MGRLSSLVGRPLDTRLRAARFYMGAKNTGSYLHAHSGAINVLAAGSKLWLAAPQSSEHALRRLNFSYGLVQGVSLHRWLQANLETLLRVPGMACFLQRPGDVVYLPSNHNHYVINLEYSVGLTFSWYNSDAEMMLALQARATRLESNSTQLQLAQGRVEDPSVLL
jgi:hypothetical protein